MTKKKAKKVIEKTKSEKYRLRPDDIQYIIELAQEHPRWSVDRIFDNALKPRLRSCLIIPLTPKIKKALKKAAKTYQLDLLDVAYHALQEWLKARKMFDN